MAGDSFPPDPRVPSFLDYPYGVSGRGTPRLTKPEDHLHDLVMQVLLTNPGERVNLPEFGVGVQRLVFAPSNEALRTTTRFLITAALQRWLGDRIRVEEVSVESELSVEETVLIGVVYSDRATEQRHRFQLRVGP